MLRLITITISMLLTSCTIIPTSWTTTEEQKKLAQENTVENIEFARRFESMDPDIRKQFLLEMIKFNALVEEVITGEEADIEALIKDLKKKWAEYQSKEEVPNEEVPHEDSSIGSEDNAKEEEIELTPEEEE